MEFVRELFPFFLGAIFIPPVLIMVIPKTWSERRPFIALFFLAIVVGFIASTFVGEQNPREWEERIVALVVDSSTAYAGSQIAYWLFWKLALEGRFMTTVNATN